ncbi:MAG: PD40 domain-containing protein [Candidatus Riflebacteria bacterium]|nr:PD40 domain-containing protein [Candidatus Riflebacteria bacterium]
MKKLVLLVFIFQIVSLSCFAGKKVVFTAEKSDQTDIMIFDTEKMKPEPLVESPFNEKHPVVSPSGDSLVFVSDNVGGFTLYKVPFPESNATWTEIAAAAGDYTYPTWSPDGSRIAAVYAPDMEMPVSSMAIVILDPLKRVQEKVYEAPFSEEFTSLISRTQWISSDSIIFTLTEYSDYFNAPRILTSTIYRLNTSDRSIHRIEGGADGFDENGDSRGFKASLSYFHDGKIFFAAVYGHTERKPFIISVDGTKRTPINEIVSEDFFGPVIPVENKFLIGLQNEAGSMTIGLFDPEKKNPEKLEFEGNARDMNLVP